MLHTQLTMMEKLKYLEDDSGKKIFTHLHLSEEHNGNTIIFLNSIFDEKKRVQRFLAETARALCEKNNHVIRFDYYGTGDSEGKLFEFEFDLALQHIDFIHEYATKHYKGYICLLGIRVGADLAIHYAQQNSTIKKIILIEPILSGKRYLLEQRTRRKVFHNLNKMTKIDEFININGKNYEDHQGYPISEKMISFLNAWNLDEIKLKNKEIFIYKLDTLFSKRFFTIFINNINKFNKVNNISVQCTDFWSSFEVIDTTILTKQIISNYMEHSS